MYDTSHTGLTDPSNLATLIVEGVMTVDSLVEFWKGASTESQNSAKSWYRTELEWSEGVAKKQGVDTQLVVDIFAVLSPGTKLQQNKIDVINVIKHGRDYKPTTYAIGREKAYALVEGVSFDRLVNPCTSPKVWNFRGNLIDPDNPIPVTVDRWIARQHLGKDKVTKYQYERVAQDYRLAAKELGIVGNQLQALVWLSARDVKDKEVPF